MKYLFSYIRDLPQTQSSMFIVLINISLSNHICSSSVLVWLVSRISSLDFYLWFVLSCCGTIPNIYRKLNRPSAVRKREIYLKLWENISYFALSSLWSWRFAAMNIVHLLFCILYIFYIYPPIARISVYILNTY